MRKNFLPLLGLVLLVPLGTKAWAQEPPVPVPVQGGQEPPPPPPEVQQGQDEGSIPGVAPEDAAQMEGVDREQQGRRNELMDLNVGLDIRAMQDPPRIAPGETGQLILLVSVSPGSMVQPGGQVHLEKSKGPLQFGPPAWDPVPAGKGAYEDSFLIRIPVTVASSAKYGTYPARGNFLAKGLFRNRDIVAERGVQKSGSLQAGRTRLNRGFQGAIVVGKPWPKPPKRHLVAGARKPRTSRPGPTPDPSDEGSGEAGESKARPGPRGGAGGEEAPYPLGMSQEKEGSLQTPDELDAPDEEAPGSGEGHFRLLLGLVLAALGVVGVGVLLFRKS